MDQRVQRLIDKSDIEDLIKKWCRAIDRLDLEAIRDAFHPDAYDDHGTFKGGVDELIAWISNRHKTIPFSMHAVTNYLIDFVDDTKAIVETYCTAMQKYPPESRSALEGLVGKLDMPANAAMDMTVSCRYLDEVTKRKQEWRISRRTVVFDSVSVVAGITIPDPEKIGWVVGKRGGEGEGRDVIYNYLSKEQR